MYQSPYRSPISCPYHVTRRMIYISLFKNYIYYIVNFWLIVFWIECLTETMILTMITDLNGHTRVLLKLLLIHITSLIFLVVAMMRGNALVHVMYMKYERSSRNFRSFPPSSRIAISISPLCFVVHHIFNFHHVPRFLLQSCFGFFWLPGIPRQCRFIVVVVSLTVGCSDWFSPDNELFVY